jgi:hypothetical protein
MAHPAVAPLTDQQQSGFRSTVKNEAASSGLSWAAIIGGALAGTATSLILLTLGAGIGFSSVSPWSNAGSNATAVGTTAIAWIILSQIIASALGGYLAGRLRTKWVSVHSDEVYFRDTAHGFLVWAVGLVITVGFLASTATSIAGGAARVTPSTADQSSYFIDSLLRSNGPTPDRTDASTRTEVGTIIANSLRDQDMPPADKNYLADLVASRTGISQADAQKRVSEISANARQAADNARKAAAHLSYWSFFALLVGAFCASLAATVGGKQRDRVVVI